MKNYLNAKLYLFENLIKKNGNVITDEKISQFNVLKKISKYRNLKLYTLNNKKNNFEIISHFFKGESQALKIRHNKSLKIIILILLGKIVFKN